ncbi:MAG: hypothetical protein PUB31_07430 [Bacteroidales bacterium]|nr:hypothetical protein [Bacteroidales bacterium]MDD6613602.1 hypothetical protein [Bacteroidales bacterium]
MNRKKIAMVLIACCTLASCNEELENEVMFDNAYQNKKVEVKQSTKQIAYSLATYLYSNQAEVTKLHQAISIMVSYGLDENLPVYDILSTNNSVFFTDASLFLNLRQAFDEDVLKSMGLSSSNYYGDLNVYWGYHDEWKGNTMPIIAYLDGNSTEDSIYGFKMGTSGIEEVTVRVTDFENVVYPIIILNFNETNYSDYPDFKRGIRSKGGVVWAMPTTKEEDEDVEYNQWTDPTKLYEVDLVSFRDNKVQYDTWIAGGSEFYLETAFVNYSTNQIDSTIIRMDFTRSEIKKAKTKYYTSTSINDSWEANYNDMHIVLREQDYGSLDTISVSLSIPNVGSVSVTLPCKSQDDIIYNHSLSRMTYISGLNSAMRRNIGAGSCTIGTKLFISNKPY